MASDKPQRTYEVRISIGADEWDGVIGALNSILFSAHTDGPGRSMVSGGHSHNFIFVDSHNQQQDHDTYFEQVGAWLEERRAERTAETGGEDE